MKVIVWLSAAVVLLGIVLSFSTCRQETSDGRVELVLLDWAEALVIKLERERVAIFERENPDIKVRVVSGGSQKHLVMVSGGVPPDISAACYQQIPHFAKRNTLMPLDKFFAEDKDISTDMFFNCSVESVRYRGKIYAMPNTCSAVVLIYNKKIFDEYNRTHPDHPVEYPNEKWTWADFRRTAKALTQDRDGDGAIDVYGTSVRIDKERFPIYVWQSGGEVISKDKKRCLMDSPEAISAIQWLYDILWVDKSAPTPYTNIAGASNQSTRILFKEERIAMFRDTRWGYEKFMKGDLDWDIAPLPKGPSGEVSEIGPVNSVSIYTGDVWFVSSSTRYPEQCWRLLKFLVGTRASEMAMRSGRGVVCNQAVAKRMLHHPGTPPDHDHIWIDVINNSRPKDYEYRVGMRSWFDMAMNEFEYVVHGRRKPDQACKNFTRHFNQGLKVLWEQEGGP